MSHLRILIVDDERLARRRIHKLLAGRSDLELIGECAGGAEAVATIRRERPDLVFLDVQMPDLDGFEVLETIGPEAMPIVVFVTAYDDYTLRAFDVHALDYLLKPFDDERFEEALACARQRFAERKARDLAGRLRALLDEHRPTTGRLAVRTGRRVVFVDPREIDWIGAEGSYVRLHVADRSHLLRETLGNLEERLPADLFLRVHRSTIVNLRRVREVRSGRGGSCHVVLEDGRSLPVSEPHRGELRRRLS